MRGANSRGVLEMGYMREIEQRDINRVVDRATRVQLQEDRMLLQVFPAGFRGGRSSRPSQSRQAWMPRAWRAMFTC